MVKGKENSKIKILPEDYMSIAELVNEYMFAFKSDDDFINQNFILKREHISRVISYSFEITKSLQLDENSELIAQLSALLHDIGRFEQFIEFGTFNDSISIDHAELAVKIIEEKGWLNQLTDRNKTIILNSVQYHNKLSVPHIEDQEILLYCHILRDADKIDIIDLTIKEYSQSSKSRNRAFSLELEDSPTVSKAIIKKILEEKLPERQEMKTVTDFRLGQLAFVYDLNFKYSFSVINKRQYLNKLFENLPKNDQIFEVYRRAKIYIENHLIY